MIKQVFSDHAGSYGARRCAGERRRDAGHGTWRRVSRPGHSIRRGRTSPGDMLSELETPNIAVRSDFLVSVQICKIFSFIYRFARQICTERVSRFSRQLTDLQDFLVFL